MKNFILMLIACFLVVVLCPIVFLAQHIRYPLRGMKITQLYWNTAIGLDQLGGSILYGQPDWTVSSRTWFLANQGHRWAQRFMSVIDAFFGQEHCKNSYAHEFPPIQNIQGKQGV